MGFSGFPSASARDAGRSLGPVQTCLATLVPTPPPPACPVLQEECNGPLTSGEQKGMFSFYKGYGHSEWQQSPCFQWQGQQPWRTGARPGHASWSAFSLALELTRIDALLPQGLPSASSSSHVLGEIRLFWQTQDSRPNFPMPPSLKIAQAELYL